MTRRFRSSAAAALVFAGISGTGAVLFARANQHPSATYVEYCAKCHGEDGKAQTPVVYRGIVPDLFREGSGAVAEGRLDNGTFVADTILAKHDERYMPPELGNLSAEHKAGKTLQK